MQAQILDLFPTAVVRYSIDPDQWRDQLQQQVMEHTGSHSYSVNTHILDLFPDLAKDFLLCLNDYAANVLALSEPQSLQTSWLNHSQGTDYTHEHMHSNAVLACCWYIDLPQGRDRIRFHKPDSRAWGVWSMMFDLDPQRQQRSPYAKNTVELSVTNGDLLVWPAWLLHSVPEMGQPGHRWSLAANTMPQSGWGRGLHEYRND